MVENIEDHCRFEFRDGAEIQGQGAAASPPSYELVVD